MKLKKYITLLLSALMLVCAMTACGPSVEHRFDTEEYSARAEATMRSIAQQLGRVESLANGHSVELYAAFAEYVAGPCRRHPLADGRAGAAGRQDLCPGEHRLRITPPGWPELLDTNRLLCYNNTVASCSVLLWLSR